MTLFESFCNIPVVAAGGYSNEGSHLAFLPQASGLMHLAIMGTPAVTVVAA